MATRAKSSQSSSKPTRQIVSANAAGRPSSRSAATNSIKLESKTIGQYVLGKTVGEGTFGKVRIATHIPTGEKVAVKILEKSRIRDQADVRRVNREIKILKKARHSSIIQLYEVMDTTSTIYLMMESADGGEMFDYIVAHRHVPERQACKFFHQIVDGVDTLHKSDITHRDLKPENLLLKSSPHGWLIKIVDFGLSNTHENGRLLSTACGSPCYAAPEMIAGKQYEGPLADIWSLGVILFALVCGFLPFEDQNTAILYRKILAGEYKPPKWISADVKDLIRLILEVDPKKRYQIADIRRHSWYAAVPEEEVPKEISLMSEDDQIKSETLQLMGTSGLDVQSVRDGLASRACNSLTAHFFLLEQKLRRKALKSQLQVADNNKEEAIVRNQSIRPETVNSVLNDKHTTQQTPPSAPLVINGGGVHLPNTTSTTPRTTTTLHGNTLNVQVGSEPPISSDKAAAVASTSSPLAKGNSAAKSKFQRQPVGGGGGGGGNAVTNQVPRLNLSTNTTTTDNNSNNNALPNVTNGHSQQQKQLSTQFDRASEYNGHPSHNPNNNHTAGATGVPLVSLTARPISAPMHNAPTSPQSARAPNSNSIRKPTVPAPIGRRVGGATTAADAESSNIRGGQKSTGRVGASPTPPTAADVPSASLSVTMTAHGVQPSSSVQGGVPLMPAQPSRPNSSMGGRRGRHINGGGGNQTGTSDPSTGPDTPASSASSPSKPIGIGSPIENVRTNPAGITAAMTISSVGKTTSEPPITSTNITTTTATTTTTHKITVPSADTMSYQ